MSTLLVGQGLVSCLGQQLRLAHLEGAAFVVSDANVFPLYGEPVCASLRDAGYRVHSYVVPPGEASKANEQAWLIYDWLIEHRAERRDCIVALGGGVVGDLAGYVAATYLRGVPLVQVPTTLLAQVDSSIGGKVAINHPKGKNLIGAFYQPTLVLVDTTVLATLPPRELRAGWAEVAKTAMILDPELLDFLEQHVDSLLRAEPRLTAHAVDRCLQLKGQVVLEDEREQGRRVILNYGHTIAHGLEAACGYGTLLHGEAVAIGMVGAARLSQRVGILSDEVVARQESLLRRFGLQVRAPGVSVRAVHEAMKLDKKSRDREIQWVLLESTGNVRVMTDVSPGLVSEVLAELTHCDDEI